ncbi:uncharacterized protein At4g13200, chloroplastic-like [Salvia miltiorrhiza]|uniref:uncharacterized protein At4g13200, chloroplastic-like n=1 Tax=Salvia miltiorrhiza TaxID=226208 RepID=UPI0025AD1C0B|nr:uncharacterized protein At4g13200, chloroplastic-like [Salvia miltiorrhiza]
MIGRVHSAPSYSVPSPSIIHRPPCSIKPRDLSLSPSNLNLLSSRSPSTTFSCNCTRDSGENESKTILDAFFLGKAVAEALNERLESAVGEFLSSIGRLQAEQQKQVQEFQDEVLEKARRAKEQAAMEAKGLVPPANSSADKVSAVNGVASNTYSPADSVNSTTSSLQSEPFDHENDPPNDG